MRRAALLIATKDISGVKLILNVRKALVKAISNNGFALGFEDGEVVYDFVTFKAFPISKGWLVNDNFDSLGFDAFHDALNSGLTKVVTIALHCETEDTNGDRLLLPVVLIVGTIVVPASFAEDSVCNIVFASTIRLNDSGHHILGDILIIGKELLSVFRQAVTTITE